MKKEDYRRYLERVKNREKELYNELDKRAVIKEAKKIFKSTGRIPPFYHVQSKLLIGWKYFAILGDIEACDEDFDELVAELEKFSCLFDMDLTKSQKDVLTQYLCYEIRTFGTKEKLVEYQRSLTTSLAEIYGNFKLKFIFRFSAYRLSKTKGIITSDYLVRINI